MCPPRAGGLPLAYETSDGVQCTTCGRTRPKVEIPTCEHTGLTIPECSCWRCTARLLAAVHRAGPAPARVDGHLTEEHETQHRLAHGDVEPGVAAHARRDDALEDAAIERARKRARCESNVLVAFKPASVARSVPA